MKKRDPKQFASLKGLFEKECCQEVHDAANFKFIILESKMGRAI